MRRCNALVRSAHSSEFAFELTNRRHSYDATDPRALGSLSLLLQAFWTRGSETPLIVLACKANADDTLNATDTKKAAEICNVYGAGIVALDGGIADEGKKMKNSFNWLIRTIMDNRGTLDCVHDLSYVLTLVHRRTTTPFCCFIGFARAKSSWISFSRRLNDATFSLSRKPGCSTFTSARLARYRASSNDRIAHHIRKSVWFDAGTTTAPTEPQRFNRLCRQHGKSWLRRANTRACPDYSASSLGCAVRFCSSHSHTVHLTNAVDSGNGSLDLHFSREDMIDKFLFASVTGNGSKLFL